MANCQHCGKPLNISQHTADGMYKSCPRCSVKDGEEHIFFSYPDSFGETTKRSAITILKVLKVGAIIIDLIKTHLLRQVEFHAVKLIGGIVSE